MAIVKWKPGAFSLASVVLVWAMVMSIDARSSSRRQKVLQLAEAEPDVQIVPQSESPVLLPSLESQHSSESLVLAGREKEPLTTPKPIPPDTNRLAPRTRLAVRPRITCDSESINGIPPEKRLGRTDVHKSANIEQESPKVNAMENMDQEAEILTPDRKLKKSEKMRRLSKSTEIKSDNEEVQIEQTVQAQQSELGETEISEIEQKREEVPHVEIQAVNEQTEMKKYRRISRRKSRKTTTTTTPPPPISSESVSDETHEEDELEYIYPEGELTEGPQEHDISREGPQNEDHVPVTKPVEEDAMTVASFDNTSSTDVTPSNSDEHPMTPHVEADKTSVTKTRKERKRKSKRIGRQEDYSNYRQGRRREDQSNADSDDERK